MDDQAHDPTDHSKSVDAYSGKIYSNGWKQPGGGNRSVLEKATCKVLAAHFSMPRSSVQGFNEQGLAE